MLKERARILAASIFLVDLALVGQLERRLAQPGVDAFRAGIDAVRTCWHACSVSHFVDS